MPDNQIDVKIDGSATGAIAAMTEASAAVKGGVESMKGSIEGLGAAFEKFKSTFALLSAVLAGGAAFKASISAANSWNSQVGAMAKQMGMTTQQASVMSVALHGIGMSTDTYRSAAMMMTRQIASNEGAFKTLGVSVKDVHTGALRPISEVMADVNTKLGSISNATERNTAGMKVYGRGWAEVQGVLKLNAGAMKEAQETAERLHLIVGPDGVAQTKAYAKEQRELGLVAESLEIQVGNTLLPVMVKLGAWLGEIGPSVADGFSKAMEVLSTVMEALWDIWKSLNDTIIEVCSSVVSAVTESFGSKVPADFNLVSSAVKVLQSLIIAFKFWVLEAFQFIAGELEVGAKNFTTFCKVANDALHLDFAGAKADMEAGFAQVETIVKTHAANMVKIKADADAQLKEVWGPGKGKSEKESGGHADAAASDKHLDFSKGKKEKKGGGGSDQMSAWKEELEAKKEAEGDFFKSSTDMEAQFWEQKLAQVKGNGKQQVAERRAIQHELYQIHKEQATQDRQLDEEAISQRQKLGQEEIAAARATIQAKKDLGQINDVQEVQQLQQLKDQEYQIELKALEEKLALYQQDKLAKQKLMNEIEVLEKKHAVTSQQSATAVALAQKKQSEAMLAPITSAMNKTVTGMIMGTQTLKQSVANIEQSMLAEFINMAVQRGVQWAATELGMTAASETAAMARTAVQTESSQATLTKKSVEASGVVGANAAEAATGASASVASIPVVGWTMAPGVFAATLAMALGAKSMIPSASKGFDIPAGVNPLTQLHEKEMVLPAEQADAVRNMTKGSSGGDAHLHVHAVDAASVERLFRNNGAALTRTLKEQHRRGYK